MLVITESIHANIEREKNSLFERTDRMKLRTDNSMFTSGLHDESIISLNEINHKHDRIIKMIDKYDVIITVSRILGIMRKIIMVTMLVLLAFIVVSAYTFGFIEIKYIIGYCMHHM